MGGGDLSRRIVVFMILAVASGVVPVSAQLNCNPGVEFYDEGPLKRCNLNGDHRLYTDRGDVVVCADGYPLVQFLDGRLRSCTLAEPSVIAGERCEALARVEFGADDSLRSCRKN